MWDVNFASAKVLLGVGREREWKDYYNIKIANFKVIIRSNIFRSVVRYLHSRLICRNR